VADDARADGPESTSAGDARPEDLAGETTPVVALDASALMAPVEADLLVV